MAEIVLLVVCSLLMLPAVVSMARAMERRIGARADAFLEEWQGVDPRLNALRAQVLPEVRVADDYVPPNASLYMSDWDRKMERKRRDELEKRRAFIPGVVR